MDINQELKKFSDMIPADLKSKFKELAVKLNGTAPIAAPAVVASPAAPAATFGEGMLEDGVTVIKYNTPELGEGSIVTVVTPEGELPAPEGTHKLQDGTEVTVAIKDGNSVVTAVKKPEGAAPVMQVEQPVAPQMAAIQNQVTGFSEQLQKFLTEKNELNQKFEAQEKLISTQTEQIKELKGIVSEFVQVFSDIADVPSGEPEEKPVNKHDLKRKKLLSLAD